MVIVFSLADCKEEITEEEVINEMEGKAVEEVTGEPEEEIIIKGKIAFASDRDGNVEIYIMNVDGSELKNLTNNPASDWGPSFSSNGYEIAFTSNRDENDEIYIMNVDGSEQTRITNRPAEDTLPRFSPDGSKIAFVSRNDEYDEIYIMNLNGSGQTKFINTNHAYDYDLCFSPDWSKIAFISWRDDNNEIYIMNVDRLELTNLTNNPAGDTHPSFSP